MIDRIDILCIFLEVYFIESIYKIINCKDSQVLSPESQVLGLGLKSEVLGLGLMGFEGQVFVNITGFNCC